MTNGVIDSLGNQPIYKTVRTSRLYEQIVQQVEDSILKGQLKPGDQLPAERDLAQRFGVSRTAVREAVKTLREKGLVEAYSGRGTFVTNGTSQAIRQSLDLMIRINQQEGSANLVELRLVLEPEIAGLAASKIDDQLLATMRESVAVMDRSLRDPDAFVEADLDFHLATGGGGRKSAHPLAAGFDCRSPSRAAQPDFQCRRRTGARAVPSQADSRSD